MPASQAPQCRKVNRMQACILLTVENTFKVKRTLFYAQRKTTFLSSYQTCKFKTIESKINKTANAVVPFFIAPSAERPLFLLQYVSEPPDAPPVIADNPASLPSCINTITVNPTQTKIYTIVNNVLIVAST